MAKRKTKENPNKTKRYLLKPNHFVSFKNRKIGRDEMTDEMAKEFLMHYPTAVKFFEMVPDDHAPGGEDEEPKPSITVSYLPEEEGTFE